VPKYVPSEESTPEETEPVVVAGGMARPAPEENKWTPGETIDHSGWLPAGWKAPTDWTTWSRWRRSEDPRAHGDSWETPEAVAWDRRDAESAGRSRWTAPDDDCDKE
jgi:hypothetical protein